MCPNSGVAATCNLNTGAVGTDTLKRVCTESRLREKTPCRSEKLASFDFFPIFDAAISLERPKQPSSTGKPIKAGVEAYLN